MCDFVWEPVTTLSGCLSWRKSSTLFWARLSLWRLQVMSNWQLKLTMTLMDDQTWQNSWKVLVYDQRSYFEQPLINTCELWICIPVCSQRSRESHYIEREVEWPHEMVHLVTSLSFKQMDLSLSCEAYITSRYGGCTRMWVSSWFPEPTLP